MYFASHFHQFEITPKQLRKARAIASLNRQRTGLPSSCSGSCDAATPANPTKTSYGTLGNVTVYSTSASSNGACGYGSTGVMYYAAIDSSMEWNGGHICGLVHRAEIVAALGAQVPFAQALECLYQSACEVPQWPR